MNAVAQAEAIKNSVMSFEKELENSLKVTELDQRLEMWFCCGANECQAVSCGSGEGAEPGSC